MNKIRITRRRFVGLLGVGAVGAAAGVAGYLYYPYAYPFARRLGVRCLEFTGLTHVPGPSDDSPVDPMVLTKVAVFTGALFGQELPPDSLDELVERLDFAAKQDSGWREEYLAVTSYVDAETRRLGAADFMAATFEQRGAMVRSLMANRRLALLSASARDRFRMFFSTIPHLTWVYAHSGVPYRLRGYSSWPGIPGDPREYTRAGAQQEC